MAEIGVVPVGEYPTAQIHETKEAERVLSSLDHLCMQAENLECEVAGRLVTIIAPRPPEDVANSPVFCFANSPLFERMAGLLCKIKRHLDEIEKTIVRVEV